MKPWKTLARAHAPGGDELILQERDGVFVIRVGGHELMSSATHGSEEAMAEAALGGLLMERPRVLIGGLGLGYTLRAALDRLGPKGEVVVAEISEAVVTWNRGPVAALAKSPLDDPRVKVEVADVAKLVAARARCFEAILLDVDNGPVALTRRGNEQLYGPSGLTAFRDALAPGGVLVVWSAGGAPRFCDRLREAGLQAREQRVPARAGGGARHTLFIARRPG